MKKYLIAGGAAVAVFAMSAFAASLNVDGGVLQAGSDNDLTCGEDVDVSYVTSNDTVGHWIGAVELQFAPECEGNYAIVNGFGPASNNQILSLISADTIDSDGALTLDIVDGPTRVADLEHIQVLVKHELVGGEYPGFEASGNPIAIRSAAPTP